MLKKVLLVMGLLIMSGAFPACVHMKAATDPLVAPNDLMSEELNTTERFRKYNSVGIKPFSTEGVMYGSTNPEEKPEMDAFCKSANMYFIKGFSDEMKDNFYKKYGTVDNDDEARNYDLIIEGKFVEIDRGNAAGRFWGTGGATRVTIRGTMTETATGKVVAKFGDSKIGTGSLGSMLLLQNNCVELGGNLSDFLAEVY